VFSETTAVPNFMTVVFSRDNRCALREHRCVDFDDRCDLGTSPLCSLETTAVLNFMTAVISRDDRSVDFDDRSHLREHRCDLPA
jgi:hypothetical protein